MNRRLFKMKMADADKELDDIRMKRLLAIMLSEPGGYERSCVIAVEEMLELQKEICKMIRKKGNRMDILQEIADVCIVLQQQIIAEGFSQEELNQAINVKLDRLEKGYR